MGRLFGPLIDVLPPSLSSRVVSFPNDSPLSYPELLPVVEAAANGLGNFVVVGESFSGPLALMFAARRPTGLRGVVLCASFVRPPRRWLALTRWIIRAWMFRFQPTSLIRLALLGSHRHEPIGVALRESIKSVAGTVMATRARAVASVDVTRELRECNVPVLDLRADRDYVVPRRCGELVRSVRPDVESVMLHGPHLLLQVAPTESAQVLAAFCDRVNS